MSAAVATRHPDNNSPHLGSKAMTSSPRSNRNTSQAPDSANREGQEVKQEQSVPTIKQPEDSSSNGDKPASTTNAPLAPPPKPNQNSDSADYFSGQHNQSHLSKEPNPFENAFGNPAETPGKPSLPGVTSLTSPAPLLPGNTPGWPGSLRSGPLSPAMLTGPTNSDYFNSDHHFSGSFPTPNESSLRTGLTPGGGGSMFPQPSPNSQALYTQLQNGGATPGTLDFHRTAMTARAQSQAQQYNAAHHPNNATSQPQQNPNIQPDLDNQPYNGQQSQQQEGQDPFSAHQTNDAANGLFMLAQAGGQQRNGQQAYNVGQQSQYGQGMQQQSANTDAEKRAQKGSVGSVGSTGTDGGSGQYSDDGDDTKPRSKTRGKKGGPATKANSANSKRKNEETPRAQVNKKQRNSIPGPPDDMDDMSDSPEQEQTNADGKKMTDEEKRKNFLERNRVAALKCRQRKKQWLANLQQKVEIFSTENDALAATVTQLREEIVGLKTLLIAHKDCPVSQAQGISGMTMQQIAGDGHQYNPYGMAVGGPGMPQGQMQQPNMQRR